MNSQPQKLNLSNYNKFLFDVRRLPTEKENDAWFQSLDTRGCLKRRESPVRTIDQPRESRPSYQSPQQSVTICSSFLTTNERLQIRLLLICWAVERKTCNDGFRDRPRHRTTDRTRYSFPDRPRLSPDKLSNTTCLLNKELITPALFLYKKIMSERGYKINLYLENYLKKI